jgi:predicted nucleic acid-binding protein
LTRIFIDTLYVIALTNSRDQYHHQALSLASRLGTQHLITSDAVLIEIANGLARNFRAEAVRIIEKFLQSDSIDVVVMSSDLFERAFQLYKTYEDKTWGLTDRISFVIMRDHGISEALTFYHHFAQAGFQVLMREQPQ